MDSKETIVALSTPTGRGAIAIVRLSGEESWKIGQKIFKPAEGGRKEKNRVMQYGRIHDPVDRSVIDEAMVVFLAGPKTYTRQDMVEFQIHGSRITTSRVISACLKAGARPAQAGEFTQRAFLNGRIDLTQAEAINELIIAESAEQATVALKQMNGSLGEKLGELNVSLEKLLIQVQAEVEFPEDIPDGDNEDLKKSLASLRMEIGKLITLAKRNGRFTRQPVIAMIGQTNVGKSSLMNAILGRRRALVHKSPGTTRDYLEEQIVIDGLAARLVDTAGLREKTTAPATETAGMELTEEFLSNADVVLLVVDLVDPKTWSQPDTKKANKLQKIYLVGNKSDLAGEDDHKNFRTWAKGIERFVVSAKTADGLNEMITVIGRELEKEWALPEGSEYTPNQRQRLILEKMDMILGRTEELINQGQAGDMVGLELEEAAAKLGEVTGMRDSGKMLEKLFSQFCIGK